MRTDWKRFASYFLLFVGILLLVAAGALIGSRYGWLREYERLNFLPLSLGIGSIIIGYVVAHFGALGCPAPTPLLENGVYRVHWYRKRNGRYFAVVSRTDGGTEEAPLILCDLGGIEPSHVFFEIRGKKIVGRYD